VKLDLTLGKSLTINTGNYSSIKPEVSITLNGIELDNLEESSYHLTQLISVLMDVQISESKIKMGEIKEQGLSTFIENFMKSDISKKMESPINELKKMDLSI